MELGSSWMCLTRSEFLFEGGGVIGERARFSMTGGGGGGGGATFFGIFLRLLIKTVDVVLFEGVIFGDDSRFILIFEGDLFVVDVCSILIGIFCEDLFVGIGIGFFNGIDVLVFEGEGNGSFFLVIRVVNNCGEGLMSCSGFNFDDGRDLDNDESEWNEFSGGKIKEAFIPSVDPLVLDSLIGKVLVVFSSTIGDDLLVRISWDFLLVVLFTVILIGFSFLITDCGCCCFFFGLIIACSTLTFLLAAGFTGENGRFCTGEWRIVGSGGGGGGGGICSSSTSLSSPSLLFLPVGPASWTFCM